MWPAGPPMCLQGPDISQKFNEIVQCSNLFAVAQCRVSDYPVFEFNLTLLTLKRAGSLRCIHKPCPSAVDVAEDKRGRRGLSGIRTGGFLMAGSGQDVVIVSAARTPVGSFNGALSSVPAHDLGKVAIEAAMERASVKPGEVEEVIMGQILTAGHQPAVRLRPARCRPRPAADQERRCRHRGCRRSGVHEPGARTAPTCATAKKWATTR